MNRIKILYIIDTLVGFAGTEHHLYEIARNLDRDRFDFTIVTFNGNEQIVNEFRKVGAEVVQIPLQRLNGLDSLKVFRRLRKLIRETSPDIVQTFHLMADTLGVLAAKSARVGCVVSSRRDTGDLKKNSHLALNRFANRWIDGYIAVCEAVKVRMEAREGIRGDRITVIHNGVDTEHFEPSSFETAEAREKLGIPADAFVIGTVSNFRPEKDLRTFFTAMSLVKSEIPELRILSPGCGKSEAQKKVYGELKDFCDREGLSSVVVFPGYASDVRPMIASMDICCLTPKSNEGFSNAILEEMAMGKPVVATDVGGNAESIVDGETGFIIPPGKPEALAEKLMILYRNQMLRFSMGRKARDRAVKTFNMEGMILSMEQYYRDYLKQCGAKASKLTYAPGKK